MPYLFAIFVNDAAHTIQYMCTTCTHCRFVHVPWYRWTHVRCKYALSNG